MWRHFVEDFKQNRETNSVELFLWDLTLLGTQTRAVSCIDNHDLHMV